MEIKKAIIPVAGLGTRFLPLSKVVSKEFWPLVDKPVIQHIVEEIKSSGIKEIIFVNQPAKKEVLNYFKPDDKNLIKLLKKRGKTNLLKQLTSIEKIAKNISFKQVFQKEPLGSSQAVLQAEKLVKGDNCAIAWADDVIESKTPCFLQLIRVFNKYQKPVIALHRVAKESFPFYGMVKVEKVKGGIFKIKKVVEKPKIKESPSNLAIVGRYIITPEVFDRLKKTSFSLKTDITLSDTLGDMVKEGEEIYGCEITGKWLECGNKLAYLKSNLYLSLKHPQFGKELRKFLKK